MTDHAPRRPLPRPAAVTRPWRPLAELDHEEPVEFLVDPGPFADERVVIGCLLKGATGPATRAYWHRVEGRVVLFRPVAWREGFWVGGPLPERETESVA